MLIRKLTTILKFIELSFHGVKIKKTIHSNIDKSVNVYNHGNTIKIGKVYIRPNVSINTEENGSIEIGDNVFINRNGIISCRDKIIIHDNCIIGPNVCIYDHDHIFGKDGVEAGYLLKEVIIEKNCWIGAGVIILKGTHIGENSVVGAGTILKGDYPANSMIYNKNETVIKKLYETSKKKNEN